MSNATEVISRLRELSSKATAAPWRWYEDGTVWMPGATAPAGEFRSIRFAANSNNAEITAAARNAFDALLDVAASATVLSSMYSPCRPELHKGEPCEWCSIRAALDRLTKLEVP